MDPAKRSLKDDMLHLSSVELEDVEEVCAYKLDVLTTDLICSRIIISSRDGAMAWVIHEETPGFDTVMDKLGYLPGFAKDWREAVALPVFGSDLTMIFKRGRRDGQGHEGRG